MTMDINTLGLYQQELLDALIHQKGIQHIINIGFKFLENPILFNDTSSKIIAKSTCHKSIGHYWDDHIKRGYFSDAAMYSSKFKKISEKVDRSNSPILLKGMDDNNMIIGKITIDYIVIGYISVTDAERPFKDLDVELFSLLCDVIETEMRNDKFYKYAKGTAYEGFLKDLLDDNIKDAELVMNKVRSLNWDVDSEVYILAFDVKQYSQKKLPLSYLIYKISGIISENKSLIYDNHIVLIINDRIKTDILGDQSKFMRNFLQKNNLYAGLSRCISDFTNLQYYYKQSLKAIELGTSLNIEKSFYSYENYAIYDLLNGYSAYENLEKFCHPSLYSLIQYDRKNNTCLTRSLYVYLMNKENQSVSANILHIHRASMFYRIDKMEKIMKLKLDDANIIHHLYLSFHILKLLHKDEFIFKINN
ncbi:helix-turn-helix domain-containing protein [Clostridium sp. PL3]|uniref:Helix-turn-helix domain-containing protein n=1 Tax=Clostridium thailandense TaxID=2794346 RepID=A0A949WPN4_9CLOT|nr:helix-turn-helix domain-containing protein [Clostridium thailandense]MBV7271520.1 helix-turn-helix domain-containing protein [Clostridium thailandense]